MLNCSEVVLKMILNKTLHHRVDDIDIPDDHIKFETQGRSTAEEDNIFKIFGKVLLTLQFLKLF